MSPNGSMPLMHGYGKVFFGQRVSLSIRASQRDLDPIAEL